MDGSELLFLALCIYEPIEERFGRLAAWLTTFVAGLLVLVLTVWIVAVVASKVMGV